MSSRGLPALGSKKARSRVEKESKSRYFNSLKNPRVRKTVCPQLWGRKWLRQFYGRLEKCVLSAGKTHVHKIPPFLGGGGGAPILFLWARGFFFLILVGYT